MAVGKERYCFLSCLHSQLSCEGKADLPSHLTSTNQASVATAGCSVCLQQRHRDTSLQSVVLMPAALLSSYQVQAQLVNEACVAYINVSHKCAYL
jgi:hypothetical protein